ATRPIAVTTPYQNVLRTIVWRDAAVSTPLMRRGLSPMPGLAATTRPRPRRGDSARTRRSRPRSPHRSSTAPPACRQAAPPARRGARGAGGAACRQAGGARSEEHTSELQSRGHLVCRLLLVKKNDIRFLLGFGQSLTLPS